MYTSRLFDKSGCRVSATNLLKLLLFAVLIVWVAIPAFADDIVFSYSRERPSQAAEWQGSPSQSWPVQVTESSGLQDNADADSGTVWLTSGPEVDRTLRGTADFAFGPTPTPAMGGTHLPSLREPEALMLLGIALVAVGLFWRRRSSRRSSVAARPFGLSSRPIRSGVDAV